MKQEYETSVETIDGTNVIIDSTVIESIGPIATLSPIVSALRLLAELTVLAIGTMSVDDASVYMRSVMDRMCDDHTHEELVECHSS